MGLHRRPAPIRNFGAAVQPSLDGIARRGPLLLDARRAESSPARATHLRTKHASNPDQPADRPRLRLAGR